MKAYHILLFFVILNTAISGILPLAVGEYNVFGLPPDKQERLLNSLPTGDTNFAEIVETTSQSMTESDNYLQFIASALTGGIELSVTFIKLIASVTFSVPILLLNLQVPVPLITLITVPLYLTVSAAAFQIISGKSFLVMH